MIRLRPGLSIPLSGGLGFDVSDSYDCTAYLFGSASGWVLFDAGAGRDPDALRALVASLRGPGRLLLTHAHADHAGGAAVLRETGVTVMAGADTAALLTSGDEAGISLDAARRADIYPADYRFRPCVVDRVLVDREALSFGSLLVTPIATPGHSRDHMSYLVRDRETVALVAGDAVFHGGRVALQNTWDCDVPALCASLRLLAALAFDMFLPGHGPFSLSRGRRHVEAAVATIDRLLVPPSL
jgi:glyoxylase-like metal-dependent hydrolase (beta-lactamase superfamily II)